MVGWREIVQLALKDSAFTEITPFEHLKYPDDYLLSSISRGIQCRP